MRTVLRVRHYNAKLGKFGPWEKVYSVNNNDQSTFLYKLKLGGTIRILTNAIPIKFRTTIKEELMEHGTDTFRSYTIQGMNEPRLHCSFHQNATENFEDEQPGYRYGTSVSVKCRPFTNHPNLCKFANDVEELVKKCFEDDDDINNKTLINNTKPFWNIGVNVVLYRDGRDKMGFHADNDQGENIIVTAVINSPPKVRKVVIKPSAPLNDGDEEVEISVATGDMYIMDRMMQIYYVHGVPRDSESVFDANQIKLTMTGDNDDNNYYNRTISNDKGIKLDKEMSHDQNQDQSRLVVVLRRGDMVMCENDSGAPCVNLDPQPKLFRMVGHNSEILEGSVYDRITLFHSNAHRSMQKGVSGNPKDGCDSIVVSGKRKDGRGWDQFKHLCYCASTKEGARGLLQSAHIGYPIRVFRSSALNNSFRAIMGTRKKNMYRYDGLYSIVAVSYLKNSQNEVLIDKDEYKKHRDMTAEDEKIYLFSLERNKSGSDKYNNQLDSNEYVNSCIEAKTMISNAFQKNSKKRKVAYKCTSKVSKAKVAFQLLPKSKQLNDENIGCCLLNHNEPSIKYDHIYYKEEENWNYFRLGEELYGLRCCDCKKEFSMNQVGEDFISLKGRSSWAGAISVRICNNRERFHCRHAICHTCFFVGTICTHSKDAFRIRKTRNGTFL